MLPQNLTGWLLRSSSLLAVCCSVAVTAEKSSSEKPAAKPKTAAKTDKFPPAPTPTYANIAYGDHERQILDFWKAESAKPTPLVFVIHGGGWQGGDKDRITRFVRVEELLSDGISVAAINYRYVPQAHAAGVKPPVSWPLKDAARALQFVRSKSADWNIDKTRVAATGGSAGACSSLWLAFHDDMADPNSNDPIARESTRLTCAAVNGAQTTLDPKEMKEWTPNSRYGSHAFGIFKEVNGKLTHDFDAFLAKREEILPWIAEYSPYALVTADDPPIYLSFNASPALGKDEKDPTHTANFGVKLQEKLRSVGVECELSYPGAPDVQHPDSQSFNVDKLKK